MLHKKFFLKGLSLSVLSGFVCLPTNVYAQQCAVIPDMVTKLFHPNFATYTVWSEDLGEGQKEERFKAAMPQGEGALAVGEMVRLKGVAPVLMMSRLDRRGREVWTKYLPVSGLSEVVDILPIGKENEAGERGFVLLANMSKAGARANFWLGFFDANGKLLKQKSITDENFDLKANDIQFQIDKKGFMVPVTAMFSTGEGKQKTTRQNAVVYTLDINGNELSSNAFILGGNNELTSLAVSKNEGKEVGYIATGWFENDFGKRKGWLLNLHKNLSVLWQREFSRGKSAKLVDVVTDKNGHYVATGHIEAMGEWPHAAWLMSVDADGGELLWQRYYYGETGNHDYSPIGLLSDGNTITLAMQARYNGERKDVVFITEEEEQEVSAVSEDVDYVHFLTLNLRGVTLSGDSYMTGYGLNVHNISPIYGSRVLMSGVTRVTAEDIFKKKAREEGGANPPLQEPSVSVTLPEVEMSDKAKAGLAKLRNNINAQQHSGDKNGQKRSDQDDSAESIELTDNGWVGIADAPKAYNDPCR